LPIWLWTLAHAGQTRRRTVRARALAPCQHTDEPSPARTGEPACPPALWAIARRRSVCVSRPSAERGTRVASRRVGERASGDWFIRVLTWGEGAHLLGCRHRVLPGRQRRLRQPLVPVRSHPARHAPRVAAAVRAGALHSLPSQRDAGLAPAAPVFSPRAALPPPRPALLNCLLPSTKKFPYGVMIPGKFSWVFDPAERGSKARVARRACRRAREPRARGKRATQGSR
jgi:hypothetical protein